MLHKTLLFVRSLLFNLLVWSYTCIHATLSLLTYPFPARIRYYFITLYSRAIIQLAKYICGIDYQVEGLEKLPKESAIIISNHQSTWETLAFQAIFPPQTWVIKKELLYLPFFGWALALLNPIAINRRAAQSSRAQILEKGSQRLKEGQWVIIFPEGTRRDPQDLGKFSRIGALLAAKTSKPIVTVAHDAGRYWPRNAFIKKPGTIKVKIGPIIHSNEENAVSINQKTRDWIKEQQF
jgi:1-acyl-sn-glycerol-3-phosphate acyltransferase